MLVGEATGNGPLCVNYDDESPSHGIKNLCKSQDQAE